MANFTKTAAQIKSQIARFSARISSKPDKPKRKFIHQMIYDIQASKDVKLTSIARALGEDISLIKKAIRIIGKRGYGLWIEVEIEESYLFLCCKEKSSLW